MAGYLYGERLEQGKGHLGYPSGPFCQSSSGSLTFYDLSLEAGQLTLDVYDCQVRRLPPSPVPRFDTCRYGLIAKGTLARDTGIIADPQAHENGERTFL